MIDTHAHLFFDELKENLETIKERAIKNKVTKVINIGTSVSDSKEAFDIAKNDEYFLATAGIHPLNVEEESLEAFANLLKCHRFLAIGECGIDLHYQNDNLKKQIKYFTFQIEKAIEYDIPIIIHSRESFDEIIKILSTYKGRIRGIFHCFTGTVEDANKIIELGFLLGIGGVVTFKNAKQLKETITNIDLKNIVLETDCPYLAPVPYRGHINESSYLKYIISEIANLKNTTIDEVDKITTANVKKLFNI